MNESVSSEDRLEILDLLGRYFFSLDTGDIDATMDCFTQNAVVRYDTGERYEGPEGLAQFARKAIEGGVANGRMHLNLPLFFEREGKTVVLRSYLSSAQWAPPDPPRAFGSLRFIEDRCIKQDGAWRIAERAIHLWNRDTIPRIAAGRKSARQITSGR